MTVQEMEAQINALKAQLAAQNTSKASKLTVKHSVYRAETATEKGVKGGTINIYGINGKFPVSLHPDQLIDLAAFMPTALKYVQDNADAIVKGRAPLAAGEVAKGSDANGLRVKAAQYLASLPKVA